VLYRILHWLALRLLEVWFEIGMEVEVSEIGTSLPAEDGGGR